MIDDPFDYDDDMKPPAASAIRWLRVIFAVGILVLLAIILFRGTDVRAAEPLTKPQWFQSLLQPITNQGCCSEADCAITPARMGQDGVWRVPPVDHIEKGRWVPAPGEWLPVPAWVILHDKKPQDGVSAYVCWVRGEIFCFVEGEAGG